MYKLIRHRGIVDDNTQENSYDAIKKALACDKYVGVEFDVRATKDNELILFHDPVYNNKLISETYYKELPKYVPRLQDILKINSTKIFLIEIKNIENNYNKFINILNGFADKNIYVMSFSEKVINKINYSKRNYKLGVLNYILNTTTSLKNLDFIGILNSLIDKSLINTLNGIEIFSYGLLENLKYKEVYYIVDS